MKFLAEHLNSLVQCATSIQEDFRDGPGTFPPNQGVSRPQLEIDSLLEVCGDFRKTLDDCTQLLRENLSFGEERGLSAPLTNILWNGTIKSAVLRLTNRLAIHNRTILLALEPFKLYVTVKLTLLKLMLLYSQLTRYGIWSQEAVARRFARGQINSNTIPSSPERLDAQASELFNIPAWIEVRLTDTFRTALPDISDPRELPMQTGIRGIGYHLDQSMGIARPGGAVAADSPTARYLHLMKSIFILKVVKASQEYDRKVRRMQSLLWADYLDGLEDVSRVVEVRGCTKLNDHETALQVSVPTLFPARA